jgi:HEAT repeat protein
LIAIKGAAAMREVADALTGADPEFLVGALKLVTAVRIPQVTELCIAHVGHSSAEVRCAALAALGELADPSSVPAIAQVVLRRSLRSDETAEKIQAAQALGKIDSDKATDCLRRVANRRPLLGRRKYEPIRLAAERALFEARSRQAQTESKAA